MLKLQKNKENPFRLLTPFNGRLSARFLASLYFEFTNSFSSIWIRDKWIIKTQLNTVVVPSGYVKNWNGFN